MYCMNKRGKEEEVEPWVAANGLSAAGSLGMYFDADETEFIKAMDKYKMRHYR